jgi:hypothetical protein
MSKFLCQVCTHAKVEEINAALTTGSKMQNQISQEYGLSKASLSRHKARHINRTSADLLTLEASKWAARADEIWKTATLAEDVRGQAQACANGLRSLEFSIKQAEKEASKPTAESEFKFRLEDIDNAVNKLFADCDRRTNLLAIDKAEILMPDAYQLFEKMLNNPELKQAVLRYAQNWETREGINHVSRQSTATN